MGTPDSVFAIFPTILPLHTILCKIFRDWENSLWCLQLGWLNFNFLAWSCNDINRRPFCNCLQGYLSIFVAFNLKIMPLHHCKLKIEVFLMEIIILSYIILEYDCSIFIFSLISSLEIYLTLITCYIHVNIYDLNSFCFLTSTHEFVFSRDL